MAQELLKEGLSMFDAAREVGVEFVHEMEPTRKEVQANGLTFSYLEWGDPANQTILFLHGALQQAHSWDFIALPLAPDYHIIALDARGHGDTQWAPDGEYSMEAHQADLDGVVEALGLHQFVLVGHSMGGRGSYIYTSRNPDKVKALTIVDTGPETIRVGQNRIQRFRELPDELDSYQEFADRVQEYTHRDRDQVLGALKYSIKLRDDGKWTWKYDKALRSSGPRPTSWTTERLWEAVRAITCPTLIVRGGASDILGAETMDKMLQAMPGSTAAVIPGAGHLVQGDNPRLFLVALRTLLDRV